METRCFEIGGDGWLESVGVDAALEGWNRGEGPYWIDVEDPDPKVRASLLTRFALDEETVALFSDSGHAARVLPLTDGFFFELPIEISGQAQELNSVAFVVIERAVLTLRQRAAGLAQWSGVGPDAALVVEDATPTGIVVTLLLAASVRLRGASSGLRQRMLAVGAALDEDIDAVSPDEILTLKREIIDLDAVCDERASVIERLEAMEKQHSPDGGVAQQFHLVQTNTESSARRLDRLDRRANDLQSRFDSHQQERMNRRLSRLTIISAIFLPLTLVAGIYGMNFEVMPELKIAAGYPLALGAMIVIAVGMVWWFRSRGWMDG